MIAPISLALLASAAIASPVSVNIAAEKREMHSYNPEVTIHESCNSTQRRMLEQALADTWEMASFAQEYIANNGPTDPVFQLYFGTATESYAKALGAWETLLTSNKEGVLLRCDDIDGNCHQDGWRGHWRGDNGTSETVICDASYTDRVYATSFCMFGYQLAQTKPQLYWGIDLIHRLFHVPAISNGAVEHYAGDLGAVLEMAVHNGSFAAVDSNALQYFAAHVYAQEIAKGGDSCVGEISTEAIKPAGTDAHGTPVVPTNAPAPPAESTGCVLHDDHYHCEGPATGAASAATSAASATSAAAAAPAANTASTAAAACHTHADGVEHCE